MLKFTFALFFLLPWVTEAASNMDSQEAFNTQFSSSRITFLKEDSPYLARSEGRYSPVLRFIFETFFSSIPSGKGAHMSDGCKPELWAGRLQDGRVRTSAVLQAALIQKYLHDCEKEVLTSSLGTFANTTKMMSMKMTPSQHPFLHPVLFHLPGNVKLRGLLGLKGDFKKRPLVVIRVGVFSNTTEFFPERAWLMMLFEQTAFNVLLVENMAGAEFIANNSRFSFGGYDEGIQNILIAQILQNPQEPLHQLIESLHLFGVSLGGHGTLFASLLNELNSPKGKPLYQSFLAMCPVVDLQASMRELTLNKPFGYFVNIWARLRLSGLGQRWSVVDHRSSFAFLDTAVAELARTYQGGLSYISSLRLPEGLVDGPDFWKLNDFWSAYKGVRQPVLILSTHADRIVPFSLNSQRIQNKALKIQDSNISVVDFKEGFHCTMPVAYDWKALSSLFQAYVLSHAPGFKMEWPELRMELEGNFSEDTLVTFNIVPIKAQDSFVQLNVHFKRKEKKVHEMKVNLPISQFDFRFINKDLTLSEQWMLERWIYQNVEMKLTSLEGQWHLLAKWPLAK